MPIFNSVGDVMKLSLFNETVTRTTGTVLLFFLAGGACRAGAKDYSVAADGSGDFRTLQAAVAAVPDGNPNRIIFHIRPGVYQGQIILPARKSNVTFAGDDAEKVILTYALNIHEPQPAGVSPKYAGIGVVILGDDFHAENITFQNTSGDHGQALALRADGDRAVFNHCRLLGWQDTLRVDDGRDYFTNCYIAGRVDFIYGSGTAVFDHCEIHSRNGGHVTAANTPQDQPYGFVFLDCRLTGDSQPWINPGGVPVNPSAHPLADLGRPWRPYARVAYIRCWMGDHIKPEGWNNWGKVSNEKTARYSEYESAGPGANPTMRVKWAHQLTAEEASAYTVAHILHGDDGWDPTQALQIPEANRTAPSTNATPGELDRTLPVLFIVGDSTVHNSAPGLLGWGDVLGRYFDSHKLIVENDAKPGRSSRTFQTQGWWAQILAAARPGDFVLIQMGDNDSSPVVDKNRCRGSIPGIGDQRQEIYNPVLQKSELVHTYGWYMRKFISDARAKGMVPLICSPVPRLPGHTVEAGDVDPTGYVKWSAEVARQGHVFFIPLNHLVLMHYVGMTPQEIKAKYFTTRDNTHASPAGAALNASAVIEGLRALKDCALNDYLRDKSGFSAPTAGE
jgi:pectinesterase